MKRRRASKQTGNKSKQRAVAGSRDDDDPIHRAVEADDLTLCQRLLSEGANVEYKSKKSKKTPLQVSIERCNLDISKLLIHELTRRGKRIENMDDNLLQLAIDSTRPGEVRMKFVETLLDGGARVNARGRGSHIPLSIAADDQDLDCMTLLIERGSWLDTFDVRSKDLLAIAVNLKSEQLLDLLLRKGYTNQIHQSVNPDLDRLTCIAAANRSLSMLRLLFDYGADHSDERQLSKLLVNALLDQDVLLVKYFLDRGADVNATSGRCGHPHLHYACKHSSGPISDCIIELLVDRGADATMMNGCRRTALDVSLSCDSDWTWQCIVRQLTLGRFKRPDMGQRNRFLMRTPKLREYHEICHWELRSLRDTKIPSCDVTAFRVLTIDLNGAVKLARNNAIVEFIQSDKFEKENPNYAPRLRRKIAAAQERMKLLDEATQSLSAAIPLAIPTEILLSIFEYLNDEDLQTIKRVKNCIKCRN